MADSSIGLGFGGTGGGGGLHFRNPPDEFIGSSLAAARSLRDTFFSNASNASILSQYQGDQSLAIILGVTGQADKTFEVYLPGQSGLAYDSSQWVGSSSAVQGNQGVQGRFPISIHINSTGQPTPATPTGGTYNLSSGVLTPPTGTTILAEPTTTATAQTWVSEAIINPLIQSGTITPIWSEWVKLAPGIPDDNSVTTPKLVDDAVTEPKIADNAVTSNKIAAGAVASTELASNAVTEDKITAGAVTRGKVGPEAIHSAELFDNAVTTAKIDNNAVTEAKLGFGAVTANRLGNLAVATPKLIDGAVTEPKLAANAVNESKIEDGAVSPAKLLAGTDAEKTAIRTQINAVSIDVAATAVSIVQVLAKIFAGTGININRLVDGQITITNTVTGGGGGGGGGGGTDDVVTTAVFDENTQTVTFTTAIGGTVTLNLGAFITATELTTALTPYTKADGTVAFTAVIAGITPTDDAHLSTKKYVDDADGLNAPLVGATFTGAVKGIDPAADEDFVTLSYFNTHKGRSPITDDLYFGTSDDAIPISAELNVAGVNSTGTIAAYAGSKHLLIARLATESDIASVTFSDDQSNTNQVGVFSKYASTIQPPGETVGFDVWVSNKALTQTSELVITVN